jgi:non-ribosomal peptide synthetase component F
MIREIHLTPESTAESDARRQREWDLVTAPMVVVCTRCGASVGQYCRSARHQNSAVEFHVARRAAVAGWSEDDIVTAQERIRAEAQARQESALNARKEAS